MMYRTDTIPEELMACLVPHLGSERNVLHCVESDLTLDRRFGVSYLVVTDSAVIACEPDGEVRSVSLSDVSEARIDELFGSGRMMAVTGRGEIPLVYYSKAHVPEFARACRAVNELVRGRN